MPAVANAAAREQTAPAQSVNGDDPNCVSMTVQNGVDGKGAAGTGTGPNKRTPPPLPQNASAIQLSNAGVKALKQGNLPWAFRCLNAAAKMQMQQRMDEKKRAESRRRPKSAAAAAPLTMVTRSAAARAQAKVNGFAPTLGAGFSSPVRQGGSPRRSSFRYDWLDCTKTYLAVKRYADTNKIRNGKPDGLGTGFLCLRFVVVVPNKGRSKKLSKKDEEACSWVVWYNTAMVFHLVAEQRGEYGATLLPKAQALWQMAGAHVNRIAGHSPKSMSQWSMARLLIWNNLAALYHERAMTAEACKMTKLVSGHVAGCDTEWLEDGLWTNNEARRDAWLCRLLLTHALAMGTCNTAGAA